MLLFVSSKRPGKQNTRRNNQLLRLKVSSKMRAICAVFLLMKRKVMRTRVRKDFVYESTGCKGRGIYLESRCRDDATHPINSAPNTTFATAGSSCLRTSPFLPAGIRGTWYTSARHTDP